MNPRSPMGPIRHPGMKVRVTSEGIEAQSRALAADARKPDPWRASWIWLQKERWPDHQMSRYTAYCEETLAKHHFAVALFRKEVQLDTLPTRALAWISADVKYRLYVNGTLVQRGPAAIGGDWGDCTPPQHWFYDHLDLTPFFVKGTNVICAEVALQGDAESDYSMGVGGLLFEAELCDSEEVWTSILSDESWKAVRSEAFIEQDVYDASKVIIGWMSPEFDDIAWPSAQVRCSATEGPWNLRPREIPPLMEALEPAQRIESIKDKASITNWVEFSRETVGHFQFRVRGAEGTRMTIAYQEIPGKTHYSETYVLRNGEQSFESPRLNAFQRVGLTVEHTTGPFEVLSATNCFTSYPVSYRGSFECSDDFLNRLWKVGRWTTQICMQSHHLDSPVHQEPLGCTGDYLIEALVNYQCFHEPALVRQDLIRTALQLKKTDGVMFHTSYTLLWVRMLLDYYDYTGDAETVKDLTPTLYRILERFRSYKGASGLLSEAPNYMFMDWTTASEFNLHHPPCSIGQGYLTLFYLRALNLGARAARIAGDEARATAYESESAEVAARFRAELWESKAGLYCDGRPGRTSIKPSEWLPADPGEIYFSLHTNALAAANGLADASVLERALGTPDLPKVQPYFMHFVFEALHGCGIFGNRAVKLMHQWEPMLEEHPTSLKENWDWGDYSHAWSATPTYQLSARVLGITPEKPGFRTVRIEPITCGLTWARGSVPVPNGESVNVEWHFDDDRFILEARIPEGSHGHIVLPTTPEEHTVNLNGKPLSLDGKRVLGIESDDSNVTVRVKDGTYRFEVK